MTAHDGNYAKHKLQQASHFVILERDDLLDLSESLAELAHADNPDDFALGVGAFATSTGSDEVIVMFQRHDSQAAQDWMYPHGDVSLN